MRGLAAIATLFLAACVGPQPQFRDIELIGDTIHCLEMDHLLGAVRIDKDGKVVARLCLRPIQRPDAHS